MGISIRVRPARPEDKQAILSFSRNTFSWGDYIPEVWDKWLGDRAGQIVVGVVDGQPIAMLHVAILEQRVAWMEGMRVHPDFRRQGLGTAVDAGGLEYARTRGCRIARLATSSKNIPAQRTLRTQGYTQVAQFNSWTAPSAHGDALESRVATVDDLAEILARWNQSEIRNPSHALLPDPYWRWTDLTESRLREQIAANQVRIVPGGFALCPTFDREKEFYVHALAGDSETVRQLALDARVEAGYRGFEQLEAMIADDLRVNLPLSNTGYVLEGAMLVYEQTL
ncbi:MAG: GNAT family N-acetyltransferase [Chloroflexi bacterium]|nr:GNAT family N-acetyltransferase [Chloroflexota bacterium]